MISELARKTGTLGICTQLKSLVTTRKLSNPKIRFLVSSQGRSGSHVLLELIGSHPDVYVDGSLFGHRTVAPYQYLRFRSARGGCDVYGFKVKPFHIERQGIPEREFYAKLHSSGWRLIYLVRSNKLRQAVSNAYASAIGFGHVEKGKKRLKPKISVDVARLMKALESRMRTAEREELIMNEFPHLRINYEDDLLPQDAHKATSTRVFEWLGLSEANVVTGLEPSTPKRLSDLVENYDELRHEVIDRGFSKFLDLEGD